MYVDVALGSDFRSSLQSQLKERITSSIEVYESTDGHTGVLRLSKLGEDDAESGDPRG